MRYELRGDAEDAFVGNAAEPITQSRHHGMKGPIPFLALASHGVMRSHAMHTSLWSQSDSIVFTGIQHPICGDTSEHASAGVRDLPRRAFAIRAHGYLYFDMQAYAR